MLIPLTPAQRALFRDARRNKGLPVNRIPGVRAGTARYVETGWQRHHTATLATLARALDITPGALRAFQAATSATSSKPHPITSGIQSDSYSPGIARHRPAFAGDLP